MQHLDEGTIHAWLDGALAPDEAARVGAHVERCESCAALVAEARGLIAGASRIVGSLDVVRGGVLPSAAAKPAANRSLWRRLHLTPGTAALLAAGLAAVMVVEGRGERGEGRNGPAARLQTPAARSVDSPVHASPPAQRVEAAPESAVAPAPKAAAVGSPSVRVEQVRPKANGAALGSGAAAPKHSEPPTASAANVDVASPVQPQLPPVSPASSAADAHVARSVVAGQSAKMAATSASATPTRSEEALRSRVQALEASSAPVLSGFEGCYEVENPPATSLRPLPDRFRLERTVSPDGQPQNVVRVIDAAGYPAEPLPTAGWRQVSQTAADVSWQTDGRPRTLTLRATGAGVGGTADSTVVRKTGCK